VGRRGDGAPGASAAHKGSDDADASAAAEGAPPGAELLPALRAALTGGRGLLAGAMRAQLRAEGAAAAAALDRSLRCEASEFWTAGLRAALRDAAPDARREALRLAGEVAQRQVRPRRVTLQAE